jgi:hypothetical protein
LRIHGDGSSRKWTNGGVAAAQFTRRIHLPPYAGEEPRKSIAQSFVMGRHCAAAAVADAGWNVGAFGSAMSTGFGSKARAVRYAN